VGGSLAPPENTVVERLPKKSLSLERSFRRGGKGEKKRKEGGRRKERVEEEQGSPIHAGAWW
jgi:hypothetical protein